MLGKHKLASLKDKIETDKVIDRVANEVKTEVVTEGVDKKSKKK